MTTVIGLAASGGNGNDNITVIPPAGALGYVAVVSRYHTAVITPPSGWVLRQSFVRSSMALDLYTGTAAAGSVWGVASSQPNTVVVAGYDAEVELSGLTVDPSATSPSVSAADGDLVLRAFGDWPDDTASRVAPVGTADSQIVGTPDGGGFPVWAGIAHQVQSGAGASGPAEWTGGTDPWLPQAVTAIVTPVDPLPGGEALFVTSVDGGRFLDQNGDPILLKGDSPWSAMATTLPADWDTYCTYLATRGLNTVILDLCPLPAGGGPNANPQGATDDGLLPFTDFGDWSTAGGSYWSRVDSFVSIAAGYGITVAMVPAYAAQGQNGSAGDVLAAQTVTQVQGYGTFLGERYKDAPNVLWLLGGDFGAQPGAVPSNASVWAEYEGAYATLIDAIQAAGDTHLVSLHLYAVTDTYPHGALSSDNATLASRVDFEFAYTYQPTYPVMRRGAALGAGPVIFGEGNYSRENNWGGPSTTLATFRRALLWAYTSGGTGDLMGTDEWDCGSGWVSRIPRPDFQTVQTIHEIVEGLPWWTLGPDAGGAFLTSGAGVEPSSGTQDGGYVDPLESDYATAAYAADGSLALVYVPTGRSFTVNLAMLGHVGRTARLVDPTNGASTTLTVSSSYANPGTNAGGGSDWLYVFEAEPFATSSGPGVVVGGVETAATWTVVLGGVEVPIVSWSVVQGGVEVPLT